MKKITVIGSGSWGTALAKLLADKGYEVCLWSYEADVAEQINTLHVNKTYLDGINLPNNLTSTTEMTSALHGTSMVVFVPPSHVLRQVAEQAAASINPKTIVVCCTKGIEIGTGKLMSDILTETLTNHSRDKLVYLSGPSFAREVATGQPTAVVIAGNDDKNCAEVQETFRTPYFLTFTHHDVRGVEVGGALKNVMAIAAGIVEGLGLGQNTRAALITRGLYEMIKVGQIFGANPMSFVGLAGMGDLILTCTGGLSRNRSVGVELGKGKTLEEILRNMKMVAEGVGTAKAAHEIIVKNNISAPICTSVYQILYEGKPAAEALNELQHMELRSELGALFRSTVK